MVFLHHFPIECFCYFFANISFADFFGKRNLFSYIEILLFQRIFFDKFEISKNKISVFFIEFWATMIWDRIIQKFIFEKKKKTKISE